VIAVILDAFSYLDDHTRYQMFKSSRGSTAMTDGHATWQVPAILVTTEIHIDVAKPT